MCRNSVVKLHEAAQMFMIVDYVREMTVKKSCKYKEYGSLGHLLFLLFLLLLFFFYLLVHEFSIKVRASS